MSAAPTEMPTTPATTETAAPAEGAAPSSFAPLTAVPAAPTPAAPSAPTWTDGFSADELAYIESKGWHKEGKGPADVLRSYRNIERLRGVDAERLVRLPDWSKPDEVAEYRTRIGVPESAEKYENHEVALPIGTLDATAIAKLSHRIGANQQQHTELLNGTGELLTELFKAENESMGRKRATELQDLAREVGPAKLPEFNQDVESAIAQFRSLLPDDLLDGIAAVGEAPFRKFLAAVGRSMREHARPGDGRPSNAPMTADVAKARMNQLRSDAGFFKKLETGDADARQEWAQLQRIAFGD